MSHTGKNDPQEERESLEEFKFLFEGLQHAAAVHPPRPILEEYIQGARPEGIDINGWHSHVVSAHIGLCSSCRLEVARLRRQQSIERHRRAPIEVWRGFLQGLANQRRAVQYVGILVLIGGLIAVYSMTQTIREEKHPQPQPPPPITTDSPHVVGGGG